jgi:hypothetical protein
MNYRKLFDEVTAGNTPALTSYIELKRYADDMAKYLEALKEQAVNEFNDQYGGREQVIAGATVSRHSSGRYTYDHIPGWKQAKDSLTLMEKVSQMAYKAGGEVTDAETGEITVPARYIANKDSISIKFAKDEL